MKVDPKTINVPLSEKEKEDRQSLAKVISEQEFQSISHDEFTIYKYVDGKSIIWQQDVKNSKFFTITTSDIARYKKTGRVDNFSGSFYIPHPLKGHEDLMAAQFAPREVKDGDVKSWIYVDDYVYAVIVNNTLPEKEDDGFLTLKERKKQLFERAAKRKEELEAAREKALSKL